MKRQKKSNILAFVFGILLLMAFSTNLSAIIFFNGIGTIIEKKELEKYIIRGAGFFLKSYSDFMLVLNKAELAELDGLETDAVKKYLKSSIENIEAAIAIYSDLNRRFEIDDLEEHLLQQLSTFNYEKVRKDKQLIKSIFDDVSSYLKKGKIKGLCQKMLTDCTSILNSLKNFQRKMKSNETFTKSELWDLNEHYSKSLLFGQYVARILEKIQPEESE